MTSASLNSTGRARSTLPPRLPLVGRREELRSLLQVLEDEGARPLTLVTGEGGVGKSRLVETLGERARDLGWSAVHGRAFPVETGVPYAVFSDAFLPLLRGMERESLTVLSRGGVRELDYLFPGMADAPPGDAFGSDGEEVRTRILWNFAEFLRALSERQPLLVTLEDLQWADQSSLQLIHFLIRQAPRSGLRYVCSYNENERHRNPTLIRVERSLVSLELARVERLEPLSLTDTEELVRETFDVERDVVAEFCALIYGWTRGNPFFLEQSLKALVDAGKLRRPDGTWLGWEIRELALPRSIRDSVVERLGRLSADAGAVAEVIAVLGTRAHFRLLATMVDLPPRRLLAALEELCDRRILAEETEGGDVVYDFVHPLVRETLYKGFGLARTRILHGLVAEAMESHYGPETREHADELAFHFARADARHLAAKAVRYLAAAGRRALARHADGEAIDYLRTAVERLRTPGFEAEGEAGLEEPALLTDLARAHRHRGEYDQARRRWDEALDLDLEPEDRARIERYGALARFWSGDPEGALKALDRAEAAARDAALPRERARIGLSRGLCLQETGRAPEAREEIQRALATASELGDRSLLARVHRSLALVNIWTGHPADVYGHAGRALDYAEDTDDKQVAFWAHWAVAVTRGLGGDTAEMARRLERARTIAEELRSPVLELWTTEMTIEHHYATGEWDSGIALGERAIALARSLQQRMLLPRLLVWTSSMYLGRDDLDRARQLLGEAREIAGVDEDRPRSVHALVPAYIGTAHYHLTVGDFEDAIRLGERGVEIAEGTGYLIWTLHRLLPVVAEAYLWLEDTDGARRTAARMRELAERLDHSLGRAWVDACEAMIRWKEGDPEGGAAAMREAAEALEAIPMVPAAARIRRQLAGRLAELGDREGALAELRRVHDTFVELGAERELDKARSQFRELGTRPPPRARGPGPSGLTEREMEVARVVARGRSNKGAARDLGISPRTVSTHLSNIFQKLDLTSRNELADMLEKGELEV